MPYYVTSKEHLDLDPEKARSFHDETLPQEGAKTVHLCSAASFFVSALCRGPLCARLEQQRAIDELVQCPRR